MQVKKCALHDRVHLNNLKIYLPRGTENTRDLKMLDILDYKWRTEALVERCSRNLERTGLGGKPYLP